MTLPEDITTGPEIIEDLDHDWIDDDRRAEWALRRLAGLTAKRIQLESQRDDWMNEILDWFSGETGPLVHEITRLTHALESYALATRRRDDRATVRLPSGTLTSRASTEPTVEITDPKAVVEWARGSFETLIKSDPKVLISDLRKVVKVHRTEDGDFYVTTIDGELVPGVAAREPETSAHVTVK